MIKTNIKVTIVHELSVAGNMGLDEINNKIRNHLLQGTSDARFWDLGKQFCYEDSYPVEMEISTRFEV